MKKIKLFLLILVSTILSFPIYSQQKLKLAILDPVVAGEKLTDGLGISVREIVSSTFVNYADNYSIVERSLLDKVIQEAKFSNSDAVDESQATQLGKLAGADRVVLIVASKFDSRCMLSIKLINVETATIDQQISKVVDYNSVLDVIEPLTLAVLGKGDGNIITKSIPSANIPSKENAKNTTEKSSTITTTYSGSGVTFRPSGYTTGYQPETLSEKNMNRVSSQNHYNVIIDFSEATVQGINILDFTANNMDQKTFNEFPKEMERLLEGLNSNSKYKFLYAPNEEITLLVKVREIDKEGRVNISDFVFVDTKTKEVLSGVRIKSKGGKIGSFPNLLGDAFEEDASPKFIKQLKSAIKNFKK